MANGQQLELECILTINVSQESNQSNSLSKNYDWPLPSLSLSLFLKFSFFDGLHGVGVWTSFSHIFASSSFGFCSLASGFGENPPFLSMDSCSGFALKIPFFFFMSAKNESCR